MYRCKINDLMKEETETSILFIVYGPSALLTPFASPLSLCSSDSYLVPTSARSCSAQTFAPPELPAASNPFFTSEIATDAHSVVFESASASASAAELQSHYQILASGLTTRTVKKGDTVEREDTVEKAARSEKKICSREKRHGERGGKVERGGTVMRGDMAKKGGGYGQKGRHGGGEATVEKKHSQKRRYGQNSEMVKRGDMAKRAEGREGKSQKRKCSQKSDMVERGDMLKRDGRDGRHGQEKKHGMSSVNHLS